MLSLGDESPSGESREWNAGRRARLARREPHRWVRRIRISVSRRSASFYLLPGLNQRVRPEVAGPMTGSVKPGEVFAEHDRAESRSHRRFRRDAMVLGEVVDCLVRMILSENR